MLLLRPNFIIFLSLFILIITTVCCGQSKEVDQSVLAFHKDSIRLLADTLPEYTNDPHVKTSQGNQISGVVRTMHQDKFNNIWFGTQNGLAQYDGEHLYYFDIRTQHDRTVTIKDIAETEEGKLWIGSSDGLIEFDGSNFYLYTEQNGLLNNDIWSVAIDSSGLIWIGTIDGLCTYNGDHFKNFDLPIGEIDTNRGVSSSNMIHQITVDSRGKVWFATNSGAHVFDGDKLISYGKEEGLDASFITAIYEMDSTNYILNTPYSGLYSFDGTSFQKLNVNQELSTNYIKPILVDGNMLLQFVRDHGVFQFDGNNLLLLDGDERYKEHLSFSLYKDRMGRIWSVGLYGAYRLENGNFINVNREGPW